MSHRLFAPLTAALLLGAGVAAVGAQSGKPQAGKHPRPTPAVEESAAVVETFQIDSTHSMAVFRVQHNGVGMFWGRFNDVTGTIKHSGTAQNGLMFDVAIATSSVDSGNDNLDGHLKSPDFFAAEEFPKATFKSRKSRKLRGNMYEVAGDLTMRGVTKPINVEVEWFGTAEGRRGKRAGCETTFTVRRSDYGISYGVGGPLGDEVRIVVAMEAVAGSGEEQAADNSGDGSTLPPRMARFDKNGDGKVQKEEMPEPIQPFFDRLDTNGDGELTAEEFNALRGGGG